ncbi:putative peptidase [Talaromyces pinophilus]|nr:putative peptidase [Talaromyces pinophilus]
MCGRYSLGVRMVFVRRRMQEQGMPVDEAPEDDEIRETYNFAPGYYGAVYRAGTPDHGHDEQSQNGEGESTTEAHQDNTTTTTTEKTKYKIQKMRWGLIPFWTKRQPDYGSMMRTINCRADSLAENKGMWTSMKRKKRCVVICQGFYEWLKKGPGGKERVPHYTRRKDEGLMYLAGLWDCVQYEGSDEKLYTYAIITTDSNPYLKFLHDRMPVILDPGSDQMRKWLDPHRTTWTKELQSILKPYTGELECYPVSKEVGKVGNDSPNFLVPVNSKENKSNIANFFANASAKKGMTATKEVGGEEVKSESRETVDGEWTEDNAPKPIPQDDELSSKDLKRKLSTGEGPRHESSPPATKRQKSLSPIKDADKEQKHVLPGNRKMRDATRNKTSTSPTKSKSRAKQAAATTANKGSQRITDFFKK